nr:YwdI family protein [uncultured Bacillus sp.]
MDISVNKLLDKISAELAEAKRAGSTAKIRERAQVIRALCELILDESSTEKKAESANAVQSIRQIQPIISHPTTQMMPQQERKVMDDEANGESIFDF